MAYELGQISKKGQGGEGVAGGIGGDDQRKVQKKTTKLSGLNHHSRLAGIIGTLRLRLPTGVLNLNKFIGADADQ